MKILIAEDDKTSFFMLESLLEKWGYTVLAVRDGDEAFKLLSGDEPPLLAILDWMLPGMSGPEICSSLREGREGNGKPYQYIIILTVKEEKEYVVEGLKAGADDYLTKPFDSQELQMRLRVGERILHLQEQLRTAALYDDLTGLLNRGAVIERLENELSRSWRTGVPLSIALLDIDHFKEVNDTYGHITGDRVLREIGRRIKAVIRSYDSLGRYGGEEFLLVFPGLSGSVADGICERVRSAIMEKPFLPSEMKKDQNPFFISASLGLFEIPAVCETVDAVLTKADDALYRAKGSGRNRVSR